MPLSGWGTTLVAKNPAMSFFASFFNGEKKKAPDVANNKCMI